MPPPEIKEIVEKARRTHGFIAHNAALADTCLYEVFHHYAGCPREMSRAIFFTLDSVLAKVTLVKRVADVKQADKDTLALIDKLARAVRHAVKHRNGVAHAFLVFHQDLIGFDHHVRMINPKHSDTKDRRLTEKKLTVAETKSDKLLEKVGKAFEALCQKLGIRPQVVI